MTATFERSRRLVALAVVGALALVLALGGRAGAADDAFSLISPRDGVAVSSAEPPLFTARIASAPVDPGDGDKIAVFVRVSHRPALVDHGLIGYDAYVDQLHLVHSFDPRTPLYKERARRHSYDRYWLNRHGRTYYWQVYYVYCSGRSNDKDPSCFHAGPVRKVRVR